MDLNAKQKEAVEYLDGPLLVLAGPGTGKTQLLSQKVAYILEHTDTNPENILCMTFTETGVSNMRERLKSLIGVDGVKVKISTYHAFGAEILAEYKNYAEDYERRLDEAIDEVTQYLIVKSIQDKLDGRDILRGDSVRDIISVISAAKSNGLSAKDLRKIAEQNLADSEILSKAISPLLKNVVPRAYKASYEQAYSPIFEILQDYTEAQPIVFGVERSIGGLARDLKDAIVEADSSEKIKPLTRWKDKYFEKDAQGNFRLKDRVANKKLLSLSNVMGKYDSYLKQNGLYDFDDMIEEAVRVLKTDSGFRATLSERYQFVMLDEFQDTNPSQFAIIKELTNYDKPSIMAVGDDDQAIYEFQGALSTNLTDFQKHYQANVIPLTENYRSTQEILDFSREIINQAPDRFADKELVAHKSAPATSQIFRHEFLSSDMEYGFIARKIAELIKSGVPQNEIAIISYKTKYFMPLLSYLKAHPGINIKYDKKDNLLEDEKIHEILTILRYVFDLANDRRSNISTLEIFSYPFFKLPILDVVKLSFKARAERKSVFEILSESENEALRSVAAWLADLAAKSFTEPLEILIDYVIGAVPLGEYKSEFLDYYGHDEYTLFTLYEKLAALRGKLKRHFGDKSLKLADLVQMLDEYELASAPLDTTSPYKDADDAVMILSAHKAKGLEFSYVFIISADHTAWGKGKGNNNLLSLPKNLLQLRHTGTTDGEKLRILYVALTRAKHTLYITNSLCDFNGKNPDRLEYFSEYEKDGKVISPFLPCRIVQLHYDHESYESTNHNLKNWLTPFVKVTPDMRSIYQSRVDKWRMSASSLTSFIDIVYAGPQRFFKTYILQEPGEPETEALAYGDLVHKTFEKVTNSKLTDEAAIQFLLSELDKKDITSDVKQKIREKGPSDIAIALKQFREILLSGKAEVNLAPEKLSIDGIPVTGKIDHIKIDDTNNTIEIYDFKTGNYHKERWRSHATLYKYMLQLVFYKLLLNASLKFRKYKVTRAHILFVTPDRDGEVYDKIYEFNDDDEKELKSIMQAVYHLVSTLEFMNDDEIMLPANNTLGLADIKKFIALLLAKNAK